MTSTVFEVGGAFRAEVIVSAENSRIQVLDYHFSDPVAFVEELGTRARHLELSKVWIKARDEDALALRQAGMIEEGIILGFYSGSDAHVLALFAQASRIQRPHLEQQEEILRAIHSQPPDESLAPLPQGYGLGIASEADLQELAGLYGLVFDSYPYPIDDVQYLRQTLKNNVVYAIVRDERGQLVAAASAETKPQLLNSEMTDFATRPDQRRKGLAQQLLHALESEIERRGIVNLYTIARSRSRGMNQTFYNAGYELTGTLVNNCHISGAFEDMHVWCKKLRGGGPA